MENKPINNNKLFNNKYMKNAKKLIMNKGFLAINYKITQKLGIEASFLLSLLIDTQDYFDNQPFFKTQKAIEEQIGLTKRQLPKYRSILVEEGLIKTWLGENSTPYYFIDNECYDNIQAIIDGDKKEQGGLQNVIGGVTKSDRGCDKMEQGVLQNVEGGITKGDTNNNKEQEQIEKTNSKNNKQELNNNNNEKIANASVEDNTTTDDFDFDTWMKSSQNRIKEIEKTPPPSNNKSVFDFTDFN
jgi:hypothetical protein